MSHEHKISPPLIFHENQPLDYSEQTHILDGQIITNQIFSYPEDEPNIPDIIKLILSQGADSEYKQFINSLFENRTILRRQFPGSFGFLTEIEQNSTNPPTEVLINVGTETTIAKHFGLAKVATAVYSPNGQIIKIETGGHDYPLVSYDKLREYVLESIELEKNKNPLATELDLLQTAVKADKNFQKLYQSGRTTATIHFGRKTITL
jgi:hypothetical protein